MTMRNAPSVRWPDPPPRKPAGRRRLAIAIVVVVIGIVVLIYSLTQIYSRANTTARASNHSSNSINFSSGADESSSALVAGLAGTYASGANGAVTIDLDYDGTGPVLVAGNLCLLDGGRTYVGTTAPNGPDLASVTTTMNPGSNYSIPDPVIPYGELGTSAFFSVATPTLAAGDSLPSGEYYFIGQCDQVSSALVKVNASSGQ